MGLAFVGVAFIFAIELLDASCRVNPLLLAGEKRMAGRADFYAEVSDSRTRLKGVATRTSHCADFILRMNVGFHNFLLSIVTKTVKI